jgi:hypothetical protein
MTIQTNALTRLLNTFPPDAIVQCSPEGLKVTNPDGTGSVVVLNNGPDVSAKTTKPKAA